MSPITLRSYHGVPRKDPNTASHINDDAWAESAPTRADPEKKGEPEGSPLIPVFCFPIPRN